MQRTHEVLELEGRTEVKRATAGFAISLVAGILIIICSILCLAAAAWMGWMEEWMYSWGMPSEMPGVGPAQAIVTILGVIGLIFGIIVLIGAYFIYTPGKETLGGILVLVFSILSIFAGGGFLIGLILGIVGGALGLAKK